MRNKCRRGVRVRSSDIGVSLRSEVSGSVVLWPSVPRSDADFGCPGSEVVRLLRGIYVIWGETLFPPTLPPDFRVRAACGARTWEVKSVTKVGGKVSPAPLCFPELSW